jgi:hypothetical protein
MKCKYCGKDLKETENFCGGCGAKVEREEVNQNVDTTTTNTQQVNVPKSEPLGTASMVIGIISLVLTFLVSIIILPLAIVGLILGIVNKSKKGKKISGIILNSIAIFLNVAAVVVTVLLAGVIYKSLPKDDDGKLIIDDEKKNQFLDDLYTDFNYQTNENFIVGKYNCGDVMGSGEYQIVIHLNEDKTFFYGPYGKTDNNYAKGTYTFEDELKTNASGQYKYYMVNVKGNDGEFIVDGKPKEKAFDTEFEIGLTTIDAKKQGVVMFTSTNNTYYCFEE